MLYQCISFAKECMQVWQSSKQSNGTQHSTNGLTAGRQAGGGASTISGTCATDTLDFKTIVFL
jgi:hypothetical protein